MAHPNDLVEVAAVKDHDLPVRALGGPTCSIPADEKVGVRKIASSLMSLLSGSGGFRSESPPHLVCKLLRQRCERAPHAGGRGVLVDYERIVASAGKPAAKVSYLGALAGAVLSGECDQHLSVVLMAAPQSTVAPDSRYEGVDATHSEALKAGAQQRATSQGAFSL
jgi:hypothetical protein